MANSEDIDLTEDYEADSDEDFEVDDADSDAGGRLQKWNPPLISEQRILMQRSRSR